MQIEIMYRKNVHEEYFRYVSLGDIWAFDLLLETLLKTKQALEVKIRVVGQDTRKKEGKNDTCRIA